MEKNTDDTKQSVVSEVNSRDESPKNKRSFVFFLGLLVVVMLFVGGVWIRQQLNEKISSIQSKVVEFQEEISDKMSNAAGVSDNYDRRVAEQNLRIKALESEITNLKKIIGALPNDVRGLSGYPYWSFNKLLQQIHGLIISDKDKKSLVTTVDREIDAIKRELAPDSPLLDSLTSDLAKLRGLKSYDSEMVERKFFQVMLEIDGIDITIPNTVSTESASSESSATNWPSDLVQDIWAEIKSLIVIRRPARSLSDLDRVDLELLKQELKMTVVYAKRFLENDDLQNFTKSMRHAQQKIHDAFGKDNRTTDRLSVLLSEIRGDVEAVGLVDFSISLQALQQHLGQ
jgi:uncharacterized protein HemX